VANRTENPGEVIAYLGPMFSGKTDALIEYMERAENYAVLGCLVFKPIIDDRGEGPDVIRAKGGDEYPAISIYRPRDVFKWLKDHISVVGFDEAQFFSPAIIGVVQKLSVERGIKVAVAGLPTDFRNRPFGPMPGLIAIADTRVEFAGICTFRETPDSQPCGGKATRTQRFIDGKPAPRNAPQVVVGGKEMYEARCPKHHVVPR
jgi:thymidine kinase